MEDRNLTISIVPFTVKAEGQVVDKLYAVSSDAETITLLEDQVMNKESSTIYAATRIFLSKGCNLDQVPGLEFNTKHQDWEWNDAYKRFLVPMTYAPITFFEEKLVYFLKIEDKTILKEGVFEEFSSENFQMLYPTLLKELSDALDPTITSEWPQFAIFDCEPSRKWIGHYGALYKGLYNGPREIWKYYKLVDGQIPTEKDVEQLKGIVISGSKFAAYDPKDWYEPLMNVIRKVVRSQSDTRLVGICFGHQITAQSLGGKVARMHIEGTPTHMNREKLRYNGSENKVLSDQFDGFVRDNQFHAVQCHGDNVTELPAEARLLASSKPTPVEMYEVGDKALCMQFHPEFNSYFMDKKLFPTVTKSKKIREKFPNIDEIVEHYKTQIYETKDDNPSINHMVRLFLKS